MVCKCLHNCIYELLTNDELMMNSCLINDLLMVYKCFIMLEAWLGASYWPNVWLSKYPYELAKYSCFLWIIFDTNCRLHILHFSLIMAAVLLFILIEGGHEGGGGVVLYSASSYIRVNTVIYRENCVALGPLAIRWCGPPNNIIEEPWSKENSLVGTSPAPRL